MDAMKDRGANNEIEEDTSRLAAQAAQIWNVAKTVLEGPTIAPLASKASQSVPAPPTRTKPPLPSGPPPVRLLVPPPPPPVRRQGGIKCEMCKQAPGGYRYKTMMVCMVCLNKPRDGAI